MPADLLGCSAAMGIASSRTNGDPMTFVSWAEWDSGFGCWKTWLLSAVARELRQAV